MPGIAVAVGAECAGDSHVCENPPEDAHRVLLARVFGIRLDALECRLFPYALDLELGYEDGQIARGVRDDADGTLGGEEVEVREVADVLLVEEDVAGEVVALDVLEQALAA